MYPIINDICSKFKPETMHFYGHLFSFNVISEEREKFNDYISENYPANKELNINSHDGRLGVYLKFMNKGLALAEAIKMLSLKPDEVVIAGDETADIHMMQPKLAKFAICSDNALEEVKKHVINMNGKVGSGHSALGIIDAFQKMFKVKTD